MKALPWWVKEAGVCIGVVVAMIGLAPIPLLTCQWWMVKMLPAILNFTSRMSMDCDMRAFATWEIIGIAWTTVVLYLISRYYIGQSRMGAIKRAGKVLLETVALSIAIVPAIIVALLPPLIFTVTLQWLGIADIILASKFGSDMNIRHGDDLCVVITFTWIVATIFIAIFNRHSYMRPKLCWEKAPRMSLAQSDIANAPPENIVFGRALALTRNSKTHAWGVLVERLDDNHLKDDGADGLWDYTWFTCDKFPCVSTIHSNDLILGCIQPTPSES